MHAFEEQLVKEKEKWFQKHKLELLRWYNAGLQSRSGNSSDVTVAKWDSAFSVALNNNQCREKGRATAWATADISYNLAQANVDRFLFICLMAYQPL